MRVAPFLTGFTPGEPHPPCPHAGLIVLALAMIACVGPITEYSEEAGKDPSGDGDEDPDEEAETGDPGDGDGDPGDGDGDGDPGDGDGDCRTPACACEGIECDPGFECVDGLCELSEYPWGKCGWNADEELYDCGYQGESPNPQFPLDCGGLILIPGIECPPGFTVEGCCDYGGILWWCQGGFVKRDPC